MEEITHEGSLFMEGLCNILNEMTKGSSPQTLEEGEIQFRVNRYVDEWFLEHGKIPEFFDDGEKPSRVKIKIMTPSELTFEIIYVGDRPTRCH